eukprot:TRINITY_DN13228_c0_g1_i1.p1 TRINITY_DN13228_c0_g1~~TRINITY_DN13228_c0_g1_i1.p1  ORF type:complete len:266 (-),score=69.58 TRINITY_DN13228_c0_g1_i1:71-868(-)
MPASSQLQVVNSGGQQTRDMKDAAGTRPPPEGLGNSDSLKERSFRCSMKGDVSAADRRTYHRMKREQMWLDEQALQAEVLEPYLAQFHFKETTETMLERMHARCEVILETNGRLQHILTEETLNLKDLKKEIKERQVEWEGAQEELEEQRQGHVNMEQQFKGVKKRSLLEECRLRERAVALRGQWMAMKRENRRLERQRREEEVQIKRNAEILLQLEQEERLLEVRKNMLEDYERQLDRSLVGNSRRTGGIGGLGNTYSASRSVP